MTWKIAALYKFMPLKDLSALRAEVKARCAAFNIQGILLIAPEGMNGTIAGSPEKLDQFIDFLDQNFRIREGEVKFSFAEKQPFLKMRVRLKKEIITMKQPEADPNKQVGTYVKAEDWNTLISDPEVIVLDTRNTYETKVGIFENAIDPKTESFTELADYIEKHLDPEKHKKVAMYCTGGIRCEKASSYMLSKGFENVYHLKGGILKYLEDIPKEHSKWKGECFVFDYRVSVGHGLEQGEHAVCFGCREPLNQEDLRSPSYEKGVSCPYCIDNLTEERAFALRARHQDFLKTQTAEQ